MKWVRFIAPIVIANSVGTLAYGQSSAGSPNSLSVTIEGAIPDEGQILASLFNSETTYLKQPYAEKTSPVDTQGKAIVMFYNLPRGDYAVSVIYDEDMDGRLDTNFLGMPTEKTGFSNDAKTGMGPASWENARFTLDPSSMEQVINIGKSKRD